MSATRFVVEPVDVLFFGPPASTTAGEQHGSRSLFPPPLSAWQGLIRGRILQAQKLRFALNDRSAGAVQERERVIGKPDQLPPGWSIRGPWPARPEPTGSGALEPWFPAPLWVRVPAKGEGAPHQARRMPDAALTGLRSSARAGGQAVAVAARVDGDTERSVQGWVSAREMLRLLRGEEPGLEPGCYGELPPFVHYESRPGLALDERGTAAPGMLYFDHVLRFEPGCGLAGTLDVPGSTAMGALESGQSGAGRKGRGVVFRRAAFARQVEEIQSGAWLNAENLSRSGRWLQPGERARVGAHGEYFAWMFLASDWFPADSGGAPLTSGRVEEPLNPVRPPLARTDAAAQVDRLEIVQAILGPPRWQGGFSLQDRKTRPNRPFLPAGSAWLLRISGTAAQAASALRALHNHHPFFPSDDHPRAALGEGLVFIGLLPPIPGEIR